MLGGYYRETGEKSKPERSIRKELHGHEREDLHAASELDAALDELESE